jgi:hypothetical protein
MAHLYPIGTVFMTRGKHPRTCTVVDQLTTKNSKGEVVSERYVAAHEFCGQKVHDNDVVAVTIARGLVSMPGAPS